MRSERSSPLAIFTYPILERFRGDARSILRAILVREAQNVAQLHESSEKKSKTDPSKARQ